MARSKTPTETGAGAESRRPTLVRDCPFGRFHTPEAEHSAPGLLLIHDVWGPSDHSRALAADLAAEGFGVLEIDLYREMGGFEIEDPGAHIRSLSDPEIGADLDAGADWIGGTSECRGRQVGVVGVCMGGTFALLAACQSGRFAAAAPFYGILSYEHGMLADPQVRDRAKKPLSPVEAGERLAMPLLASFGEDDPLIPVEDLAALEAALSRSGQPFQVDRYANAGHAFLNRTRPDAYREVASRQAWERVIPFLHRVLD